MAETDIWNITSSGNTKNTNCTVPKSLLDQSLRSTQIKLPLIFKVTCLETNRYAFCVADNFHENIENGSHSAMISPIVMKYLEITESSWIASIDLINGSPDLIPHKPPKPLYLNHKILYSTN